MDILLCAKCGGVLEAKDSFCRHCGKQIPKAPAHSPIPSSGHVPAQAEESGVIARRRSGFGCSAQAIALMLPVLFAMVAGAAGLIVGIVLGILVFVIGSLLSARTKCPTCGRNVIGRTFTKCPGCGSSLN